MYLWVSAERKCTIVVITVTYLNIHYIVKKKNLEQIIKNCKLEGLLEECLNMNSQNFKLQLRGENWLNIGTVKLIVTKRTATSYNALFFSNYTQLQKSDLYALRAAVCTVNQRIVILL
jgi:hypothetical protein